MPLLVEVPAEYGYVLAVASSSVLVNYLHFFLTIRFRKASGIKYPASYASEEQAKKDPNAHKFNCAQRAHANFTENHTSFLVALTISGLRSPVASAMAGAAWVTGRIIYALGYTSNAGPDGRVVGAGLTFLPDLGLKIGALYTSAMYILG